MAICWEERGCDEEMQSRCPHNIPGEPCPAECHFSACTRPTHVVEDDLDLLLNPELDYEATVKQVCKFCHFFLTQGPRFVESELPLERGKGTPNRFIL